MLPVGGRGRRFTNDMKCAEALLLLPSVSVAVLPAVLGLHAPQAAPGRRSLAPQRHVYTHPAASPSLCAP